MENQIIKACSPPICGCLELEITEDVDGNKLAVISDDTGGVVVDTLEAFNKLIYNYIHTTGIGKM